MVAADAENRQALFLVQYVTRSGEIWELEALRSEAIFTQCTMPPVRTGSRLAPPDQAPEPQPASPGLTR